MSVYVVGQVRIHDPVRYADYTTAFRRQFPTFTGEVLAADENPATLEGDWPWSKTVILKFETEAAALTWHRSADYQAAADHRRASADCNLVIVKGQWAGRAEAEAEAEAGATLGQRSLPS